ncbi:MAG TPA: type II toxin-antitoxin system Phd/YefM family antitoxin [Rhizomicrobium sp.]|jgi:prevent-host-death family protein|nr:type II toxin-antitoxin system Phd/YefM family antitoxin [Rhizomicrobium sp.]
MDRKPTTINLRDANQQFSKLVREVEESGREYVILRNGKEAARLMPTKDTGGKRKLTPEQEAALARITDPKNHGMSPPGWRFSKDEMWEDAAKERAEIKAAREAEARAVAEKKTSVKAVKRG